MIWCKVVNGEILENGVFHEWKHIRERVEVVR